MVEKGIQAVYFDFDGVITLDVNGSTRTFKSIYDTEDVGEKTGMSFQEFYSGYSGEEGKQKFMYPLEKGKVVHKDILAELSKSMGYFMNLEMFEKAFLSTEMHPEMLYIAQKLGQAGYTVGMITDNPWDRMKLIINHQGLERLFNPIVVSSNPDVGTIKKEPNARAFLIAAERSGIPLDQSIFIDNSSGNVEAAKNKGMADAIKYDDSSLRNDFERRQETLRIEQMLKQEYKIDF